MSDQLFIQRNNIRLPLSGNLYSISINGEITDASGKELQKYIDNSGNLCINIAWIYGYRSYKVAELMVLTFKPVCFPFHKWKNIWVLFKDGDKLNIHPSNLIQKFPTTGIESDKYPGFYYIPNYTGYVINKAGLVLRHLTGNILTGSLREKGYVYFTLSPDIVVGRPPSIGRHRLLAMVFLNYNESIEKLDVNHKDGVPGNDSIDNLEWTTRQENIKHAFLNNLRHDNKPVLVTNHNTGVVSKYYSAHECGRCLDLGKAVVHWRIKKANGKIFPPGLSFKYEYDNYKKCNNNKHSGFRIKLINTLTKEIYEFNSFLQCSSFLKVSKKVIQKRLRNSTTGIYKEYILEKLINL